MKKREAAAAVLLLILVSSCATGIADRRADEFYFDSDIYFEAEKKENINGLFPDRVFIKTKTQSFNSVYEFQLYNGKIYYKDIKNEKPELWTLLEGTGLPANRLVRDFISPDAIIEISADSNVLYALSDKGIFYNIKFTEGLLDNGWHWVQQTGFPDVSTLRANDDILSKRGWAMSRRGEEVLWYEDINGNQHHYGTIGIVTNYFLMKDGQEIRFADPGLPSDFSHNFLGPERGCFIAESISASASTIFLINRAGEMYTRLVDFDSVGSDPMFFKYTYDREYSDERLGSEYGTNFNPWALPAEDWFKQPSIKLEGNAAVTDRITILQTGHGNNARELRAAGLNKDGAAGFYYKMIDAPDWDFTEAPLDISVDSVCGKTAPRGESPDKTLYGMMWVDGEVIEDISLRLERFNIFEGKAELFAVTDGREFKMDFYPVEMWYYLKRELPGRDGSPKLMMATIDLPDDKTPGISEYFEPFDEVVFAFTAEAAEGYLLVNSASSDSNVRMIFTKEQNVEIRDPQTLQWLHLLSRDEPSKIFFSDKLMVPDMNSAVPRGIITGKLEQNKTYLKYLKRVEEELTGRNISSQISDFTYSGVERILAITLLNKIDYPKIKTVTMHSGVILDAIAQSAKYNADSRSYLYEYMEEHVERRIEHYQSLLDGTPSETFFAESPADYFIEAGLPFDELSAAGEAEYENIRIETGLLDYIPAIFIFNEESKQGYLLVFQDFESSVNNYLQGGKNLVVKGGIIEIISDETYSENVDFNFDGSSIVIQDKSGKVLYSRKI